METVVSRSGRVAARPRRGGLLALLLAGGILPLAPRAAAQDLLKVRGNPAQETQILEETDEGVRYRTSGGGSTVVEWENIEGIRYANEPAELKEGVAQIARANFADAVDPLSNLAGDARLRDLFIPRVKYLLGLALAGSGQFDEAVPALEGVIQDDPRSRYVVLSHELLAEVLHANGKDDEARSRLQSAIDGAKQEHRETLGTRLQLILARLDEATKRSTEARELYGTVGLARGRISLHGKVGTARMALAAGDLDGAASQAEAILGDEDAPPQVLAGAYNVRAGVHLERALAKKDPGELEEALFDALRGVVLFPPGNGDPTFEHERALLLTGKAFSRFAQTMEEGERRRKFLDRASDRLRELIARFPISFLREEAESVLQRVAR